MNTLVLTLVLLTEASSAAGGVVINEVLYHAPDDLDLEYVELHNASDADVDLSGWGFTTGIKYTFPEGATIPAGGYLVLARNRGLFGEFYAVETFDSFEGSLANGGEKLTLSNAAGEVVESVAYEDRAPWPISADGCSASLERICPTAAAANPANWAPSPLSEDSDSKPAGTPGQRNHGFSPSLPPAIKTLWVHPTVCRPGEEIGVEAVVEKSDSELKSVELLYRVVEPGNEGDEIVVPMEPRAGGRFSASVPGQSGNRIVRIRVRASDASGAARIEPPPYDLRPAESVWVIGEVDVGKIPVVQFFNVGAGEFRNARDYLENQRRGRGGGGFPGGGFRGRPRFTEEDRARMDADRSLSPAALERAWASLVLEHPPVPETRDALLAAFRAADTALAELRDELEKAADVTAFAKGLPARLVAIRERLVDETKHALGAENIAPGDLALLESLGGDDRGRDDGRRRDRRDDFGGRGGPRGGRPGGFGRGIASPFDIESSLFRASMLPGVTSEQLVRLEELHREALAKREDLGAGDGERDFRAMFERAGALRDELREAVAAVLTPEQRTTLDAGERDRTPFGRPGPRGPGFGRFGSPPGTPLPSQGRSAFIYTDPETRETRLFDFVHIVERKSGYKVRLHRDRPLDGMTTLNVLYEPDERSILTEALAYDLYRLAGNATPKTGYLRVLIDGEVAGYHLVFEQPNGAFFRRQDVAGGNLYKVIWQGSNRPSRYTPPDKMPRRQDIVRRHEKKTNPHDGYEDLITLIETLERTSDPTELWDVVQRDFDVDQVIIYFAVNTLLSHWDGFFNNYFLYHDVDGTGKWTMYPWDQDSTWGHRMSRGREVFAEMPLTFGMEGDAPPGGGSRRDDDRGRRGPFGGFGGGGAWWWRAGGEISRPLLANPEFRKRFLARVEELAKTVYTEEVFGPRFEALRSRLEDEVRLRARTSGRSEEDAVRELDETLDFFREHLVKRREYILANVGAESQRLKEGAPAGPSSGRGGGS